MIQAHCNEASGIKVSPYGVPSSIASEDASSLYDYATMTTDSKYQIARNSNSKAYYDRADESYGDTKVSPKVFYDAGMKVFSCPVCSYTSTNSGHVRRHILVHTKEKPYACHYCPYRSTQKINLKAHVVRMHLNATSQSQPF